MSSESLRQSLPIAKPEELANYPESPFALDERFWGKILSLYKLRLTKEYGLKTFNTLASISIVLKEIQIPNATKALEIMHGFSSKEEDVFQLMQEEPWSINPLSPPTEKEKSFVESMDIATVGDFKKRKELVIDFFSSEPTATMNS